MYINYITITHYILLNPGRGNVKQQNFEKVWNAIKSIGKDVKENIRKNKKWNAKLETINLVHDLKMNKEFGNDEMKKTTIKLNNGKALRGVTKLGTNLSNNGRSKRGTLELGMNWTNNWCGNNEMGNDELEKETRKN